MDGFRATLNHGARIEMPLNEFHDILPLSATNGPRLSVDQPQTKLPPGSTMVWTVSVEGNGSSYDVDLFGVSKAQATTSGQRVGPAEEIAVTLAIPSGARAGEVFEIILSVTDRDDRMLSAALRLTAIVDPDAQAPATTAQTDDKSMPTPGAAFLVTALALLGSMRRRRAN